MEGNGVGPMGSAHLSLMIFPIESSKFFKTPISVFSSFIFKCATFLDTQCTRNVLRLTVIEDCYIIFLNFSSVNVAVEKGLIKTLHAYYIEDDSLDNSKNKRSHSCFWKRRGRQNHHNSFNGQAFERGEATKYPGD